MVSVYFLQLDLSQAVPYDVIHFPDDPAVYDFRGLEDEMETLEEELWELLESYAK